MFDKIAYQIVDRLIAAEVAPADILLQSALTGPQRPGIMAGDGF